MWRSGRGAAPARSIAESRNDFFDSMYHAAGAVGINTSAQIECGIVGRPVFSIRTPAYQRTQEGTLHFRHLTTEGGGLLQLADDFETHLRQIAEALDDPDGTRRRIEGFVKAFTRPHGLTVEATPRMVEAIERWVRRRPPRPSGCRSGSIRCALVLYPVAVAHGDSFRRVSRASPESGSGSCAR